MNADPTSSLLTLLSACVSLLIICIVRMRRPPASLKARRLQTADEEDFFKRLRRAVPNGHILPNVALSALLEADDGAPGARLRAARKLGEQIAGWVVCDDRFNVICVVELDDEPSDSQLDQDRDRMLASAGIACIRWQRPDRPSPAEIRSRVEEVLRQRQPEHSATDYAIHRTPS